MKSRKAKSALKGKAFLSKKKLKGNLPLNISDSGSDVDSESFFHDEMDDFQNEQENQLSTDDELIQDKSESSSEEEVLSVTDDEKDDTGAENDLENAESSTDEEDLPNRAAWGKKKSMYYNADFVDEDRGKSYREKDEAAAKAEAEEAIAIQKSIFSNVNTDHLATNLLLEDTGSSSSDDEEVTHNLASATTSEKIMYLKKTSPEMFKNFGELQSSLLEIKDKMLPQLHLAPEGKLPHEECAKFIKLKYTLLAHYTTNLSFYMMLKSSKEKTDHHPVLERLASYKRLLDQVQVVGEAVSLDVQYLKKKKKEAASNGVGKLLAQSNSCDGSSKTAVCEEDKPKESKKTKRLCGSTMKEMVSLAKAVTEERKRKKIKKSDTEHNSCDGSTKTAVCEEDKPKESKKTKRMAASTVEDMLSLAKALSEERKRKKIKTDTEPQQVEPMDNQISPEQDENLSEEKRTITYQIAKNKGLVAHRKKEYRNPRVRHREKFRKAKIRRKGQVRDVVKEVKRYDGEPTGISTHVVRSIKFK